MGVNRQAVKRTNTAHTSQNISWPFQKCTQWHYKCTHKKVNVFEIGKTLPGALTASLAVTTMSRPQLDIQGSSASYLVTVPEHYILQISLTLFIYPHCGKAKNTHISVDVSLSRNKHQAVPINILLLSRCDVKPSLCHWGHLSATGGQTCDPVASKVSQGLYCGTNNIAVNTQPIYMISNTPDLAGKIFLRS